MSKEINLLYLLCTTCLDEEIPELYLADKPSFEIISTIIMEQWTNMYPCREWSYGIFIDIIKIDTNKILNTYFSTGKPDEPSVQRWLLERDEMRRAKAKGFNKASFINIINKHSYEAQL